MIETTHNPLDESYWASCLRENRLSSSYGEGLETDRASAEAPRQSLTRQVRFEGATMPDPAQRYPRCEAGAQRAPPEDCGGPGPFMDRWQRDPKEVCAAHNRSTVIRLAALVHERDLDAREFRARAREILCRQPVAAFDRAAVNRRLQRYAREGYPAVTGDIE